MDLKSTESTLKTLPIDINKRANKLAYPELLKLPPHLAEAREFSLGSCL